MNFYRPSTLGVIAVLCIGVACAPQAVLGQDDGFRAKIPTACQTREGCAALRAEAEARVSRCRSNTVGVVRCDDARDDLRDVDARIADLDAKAGAADSDRRRAEDQKREAQEQEEKRQAQQWLDGALGQCKTQASTDPCQGAPKVAMESGLQADCFKQCGAIAEQVKNDLFAQAVAACVTKVVDSRGKKPTDCDFGHDPPAPLLEDRRDECAAKCREEASKQVKLPPAPVRATHPAKGASSGQSSAKCCDGTLSPTCLCPGHKGCCDHHGGVCGCGN
jgi:hypothetical protein